MRSPVSLLGLLFLVPFSALPGQLPASRESRVNVPRLVGIVATVAPIAIGVSQWGHRSDPYFPPNRQRSASLIGAGIAFGRALGYFVAGRVGRGLSGAALRIGAQALSFIPALAMCGWDCGPGDNNYDKAWLLIATGTGVALASMINDLSQLHPRETPGMHAGLTVAPAIGGGVRIGARVSF